MDRLTENTFKAIFALEDLREILRRTAPFHRLNEDQKREVLYILSRVRKLLDEVEAELR